MEENVGNIPLTSVEERRGRFKRNGFSAVVIDKEGNNFSVIKIFYQVKYLHCRTSILHSLSEFSATLIQ